MQLRGLAAGLALVLLATGTGHAQSLSPMRGKGPTPSAIKGFSLTVGNPYKTAMTFALVPMDAAFLRPAGDAVAQPDTVTLAPGFSRRVIVAFKIPPGSKERTIGLCITPQNIKGPILPRVCGTYTGVVLGRPSG